MVVGKNESFSLTFYYINIVCDVKQCGCLNAILHSMHVITVIIYFSFIETSSSGFVNQVTNYCIVACFFIICFFLEDAM